MGAPTGGREHSVNIFFQKVGFGGTLSSQSLDPIAQVRVVARRELRFEPAIVACPRQGGDRAKMRDPACERAGFALRSFTRHFFDDGEEMGARREGRRRPTTDRPRRARPASDRACGGGGGASQVATRSPASSRRTSASFSSLDNWRNRLISRLRLTEPCHRNLNVSFSGGAPLPNDLDFPSPGFGNPSTHFGSTRHSCATTPLPLAFIELRPAGEAPLLREGGGRRFKLCDCTRFKAHLNCCVGICPFLVAAPKRV